MMTSAYRRAFAQSAVFVALSVVFCGVLMLEARPAIAQEQTEGSNYLDSKALRARALGALLEKLGEAPIVSSIQILPDEITVLTQGTDAAYHTDEWRVSRLHVLVIDQDRISGPSPAQGDSIVSRKEESFFPLADIDVAKLDKVVEGAIAMASMEDRPQIASVTIARHISILPEPSYGDVRWSVSLATAREQATVYANAGGTIIGGDLAGTTRAQRLDMVADDNWPMQQAQEMLTNVLAGSMVQRLSVNRTSVSLDADHPTDKSKTRDYSWDLSGVRQGFMDMPNMVAMGMGDIAPFTLSELDLAKLPQVKQAAIAAFEDPSARIIFIDASKPTDRPGRDQPVLWQIRFAEPNGEEGRVLLNANAEVVNVQLPPSRIVAVGAWLAPGTIVDTLARLGKEFGPNARFTEIVIDDERARVNVEDPKDPGSIAQFIIDGQTISRFGTPMPWDADVNEGRTFTLADLAPLDEKQVAALSDDTLGKMALKDAAVYRYTISRNALIMDSADNRLLLEIRAGKDDGWTGGWVTYDMVGQQVDIMTP